MLGPPRLQAAAPQHLDLDEGSVEGELLLALDAEGDGEVRVHWTVPVAETPTLRAPPLETRPGYHLSLRYTSREGPHWTFEMIADADGSLPRFTLRDIPEPDDLLYHVHYRLPAAGGCQVRLRDGPPIVLTTAGAFPELELTSRSLGEGSRVELGEVQRPTSLLEHAASRRRLIRRERAGRARHAPLDLPTPSTEPPSRPTPAPLSRADFQRFAQQTLRTQLGEYAFSGPPPRQEVLQEFDLLGLHWQRILLKPRERVEMPAWACRPQQAEGDLPAILYLAPASATGIRTPATIERVVQLGRAGYHVLVYEAFGAGERLLYETHDGPGMLEPMLLGIHPATIMVKEARAAWACLGEQEGVDDQRIAVLGEGVGAWHAVHLSLLEPGVAALILARPSDPEGLDPALESESGRFSDRCLMTVPGLGELLPLAWRVLAAASRPLLIASDETSPAWLEQAVPAPLQPADEQSVRASLLRQTLSEGPEGERQITSRVLELLAHCWPEHQPEHFSSPDYQVEDLAEALEFGFDYMADLWYSWTIADSMLRIQSLPRPPHENPVQQRLAELLGLATEGELLANPEQRRALLENDVVAVTRLATDQGSLFAPLDLTRGILGEQLLAGRWQPDRGGPITVAVGDLGKLEALEQAHRLLPQRPGELWLGVDLVGAFRDDDALTPRALEAALDGHPLLGIRLRRLEATLELLGVGRHAEQQIRLFGTGSGGLLVACYAVLHAEVAEVHAFRSVPNLRVLLQMEPDALLRTRRDRIQSLGPDAALCVPQMLANLPVEDLILALKESGTKVQWHEPVDARGRMLSRHERLAMWPRVRHQSWVEAEGSR